MRIGRTLRSMPALLLLAGAARADGAPATPPKEISPPTWPVAGVYASPDTKDVGTLTAIPWLSGVKVRGWVDAYYVGNLNHPDRAVINANQSSSAVRGNNASIQGRTFDIHDRSFTLSLAEIEVERVPERGGVGFKVDLAMGDTPEIIVNTIRQRATADVNDTVTEIDKALQHASVSYIAPIGRGVRFDFGKFVTHIGGETIESVKNWNYSRSFYYTHAIPFQDVGLHVSYPWTDTLTTDVYVLNGWNSTVANNTGINVGPGLGWTPAPWLGVTLNYLGGPQQPDNTGRLRHIVDGQVVLGPIGPLMAMVNVDVGHESDVPDANGGLQSKTWWGVTGYLRYRASKAFEPSLRVEYYNDSSGFTTTVPQSVVSTTLTLNIKLGLGTSMGGMILLRPEARFDQSTANFFAKSSAFRGSDKQTTVGIGVAYLF